MKVSLIIEDYEIRAELEKEIKKQVALVIEPKVAELLQYSINNEEVARIIGDNLRSKLNYGSNNYDGDVARMFGERIKEVSDRITDDELKKFILSAFMTRLNK